MDGANQEKGQRDSRMENCDCDCNALEEGATDVVAVASSSSSISSNYL